MLEKSEYDDRFIQRLAVVGSPNITPENSDKYWIEHKDNMTWGIQKALYEARYPRDVAILGAGKCNDIRLHEIMQVGSVENIDLYDLHAGDLQKALAYITSKIKSIMPEALDFARINPVIKDVTCVMKRLFSKFDVIRKYFNNNLYPYGVQREKEFLHKIKAAFCEVFQERETEFVRYDTVVSDCILSQILAGIDIQLELLINDVFELIYVNKGGLQELKEVAQKMFIADHMNVLQSMTRPGGSIFIASDRMLLYRGRVHKDYAQDVYQTHKMEGFPTNKSIRDFGGDYIVEQIEVPRFEYLDGDLEKIAQEHLPEYEIVGSKTWEWNRQPHELRKNGDTFSAEEVQGVVLKNLSQK
ncbi:hypothetical protein GF369_04130 [Candidatus Peregrinibacteria bacterium]|nr:hypothetical protein [Candidatus Peregrinibacteria bacterium]